MKKIVLLIAGVSLWLSVGATYAGAAPPACDITWTPNTTAVPLTTGACEKKMNDAENKCVQKAYADAKASAPNPGGTDGIACELYKSLVEIKFKALNKNCHKLDPAAICGTVAAQPAAVGNLQIQPSPARTPRPGGHVRMH